MKKYTTSIGGRHGGVEKRGGWKTSRMTPLPKGPPRTVRFPPPSGVSALFFLYKNPRFCRPEAFLEGSKNVFGERVLWYVFLPPYVLHPPHIRAQIKYLLSQHTLRLLSEPKKSHKNSSVTFPGRPLGWGSSSFCIGGFPLYFPRGPKSSNNSGFEHEFENFKRD